MAAFVIVVSGRRPISGRQSKIASALRQSPSLVKRPMSLVRPGRRGQKVGSRRVKMPRTASEPLSHCFSRSVKLHARYDLLHVVHVAVHMPGRRGREGGGRGGGKGGFERMTQMRSQAGTKRRFPGRCSYVVCWKNINISDWEKCGKCGRRGQMLLDCLVCWASSECHP